MTVVLLELIHVKLVKYLNFFLVWKKSLWLRAAFSPASSLKYLLLGTSY